MSRNTAIAPKIIAEDGTVEQADLLGEVPAPVESEVERALRGWLFLPKLVKGKPVAVKAVVPLQVSQ